MAQNDTTYKHVYFVHDLKLLTHIRASETYVPNVQKLPQLPVLIPRPSTYKDPEVSSPSQKHTVIDNPLNLDSSRKTNDSEKLETEKESAIKKPPKTSIPLETIYEKTNTESNCEHIDHKDDTDKNKQPEADSDSSQRIKSNSEEPLAKKKKRNLSSPHENLTREQLAQLIGKNNDLIPFTNEAEMSFGDVMDWESIAPRLDMLN